MSEVTVESELRRLLAEANALIDRMIDEREAERDKASEEINRWMRRSAGHGADYLELRQHPVVRLLFKIGVIRNV